MGPWLAESWQHQCRVPISATGTPRNRGHVVTSAPNVWASVSQLVRGNGGSDRALVWLDVLAGEIAARAAPIAPPTGGSPTPIASSPGSRPRCRCRARAPHRTVTGTFASDAWPHAVGSAVAGYGKPSQLASATNGPSARPLLTWASCDGNTWMKSNAP